jgi:limonene 1,2-monooxygenase
MTLAPAGTYVPERLRFGIFLAPFHPLRENPELAVERDFQLVEHLDRLGYDEAWIGEHHSAGFEIIPSPEIFIAAAAQRTRHIRLGTGVISLPYHHPLMVGDRVLQLDLQTRGRFLFGVGPGALPSDALMMGIDPLKQRDMMDESLSVLVPLLEGETVSHQASWFTLANGRLQVPRFTRPRVEMAVAAQMSPAGPKAAGKYGLGMLSIGSTTGKGYMALAEAWGIVEEMAALHRRQVSRAGWRLVGPMHLAETREQAIENVRFGLMDWVRYFSEVLALAFVDPAPADFDGMIRAMTESGYAVIGTPDDAIRQIERLAAQSGGFGCFLQLAHNWADWPQIQRSYELMARYVMPRFQSLNPNRQASYDWAGANRTEFLGAVRQAKANAAEQFAAERKSRDADAGRKGSKPAKGRG